VLGSSECIAVAHRPSATFRRVLCTPTELTWIGGDAGVAIATASPDGWGDERIEVIAIDLANGTAHHVDLVRASDDDAGLEDGAEVRVRSGALVVTAGGATHRIALTDLLAALRASAASPAPPPRTTP